MKKLIYVSVMLFSLTGFGQTNAGVNNFTYNLSTGNVNIMNNPTNGRWIESKLVDKGIEGSEYIYKSWQPKAVMTTVDGKQYIVPFVNFNARLNSFAANVSPESKEMYSVSQDSAYIFNSSSILKVKINNKEFVKASNKFHEVVFAKKDTRLLKLYEASIKSASFNPMTQQKMGKDKMVVKSSYFLDKGGLKEFKLKTKSILNLLADKKTEVQDFIKSNRLSVKNENHLTRIFNYYNSL